MTTVYGLPGIRNWHRGAKTVGKLQTYFEAEGYPFRLLDYGYVFFLGMLYMNKRLARILAATMQDDCIIVAHSNGCAIAALIAELGLRVKCLIMIQPALDADWKPPDNVQHMHVFFNSGDRPTVLASKIPFLKWGKMGNTGPLYLHDRVTVTNTGRHGYMGHNVEFEEIEFWGPRIVAVPSTPPA